jgi:uncharacterized protein YfdQ (DUF2303 family)
MNEDTSFAATETAALLQAAQNLGVIQIHNGTPLVVHGKDFTVTQLPQLRDAPQRVAAKVVLMSASSFVDYLIRYAEAATTVFCDRAKLQVAGIVDYHEGHNEQEMGTPGWCQHRATLSMLKSRQLKAWLDKSGVWIKQVEFADFIEDHVSDIVSPSGSEMLQFAQELIAHKSETFRSSVRLGNGDFNLNWKSETQEEGSTKVFYSFDIGVPLFESSEVREKLTATCRHRITEGKLEFRYHFPLLEDVIDTAWTAFVATLKNDLPDDVAVYEAEIPAA